MGKSRRRFRVECPRCGRQRNIETTLEPINVSTSCFVCGRGFSLISKDGKFNRIIREL